MDTTTRASRAGHTFHERWASRRALQLVFPKDNLFSIVIEGMSPNEHLKLGQEAEEIADLILYYGSGDTFDTCTNQQILQFKYKIAAEPVTSSYLKKTIKKFAATLRAFRNSVTDEEILRKLSFGFVTNAEFSDDLWETIKCLQSGKIPKAKGAKVQHRYLNSWCQEEGIKATDIFPLIEFRASTSDLPSQNRLLRRTVSDWSANSTGQAAKRLFALVELIREKAQIEGQGNNSIRREDVLDALECDEDQLFPADTRFVDVGDVVERDALKDVKDKIITSNLPVFLHADGGVGKTVFIQSLAANLKASFEVVVFDCFGGGSYRSEAQARHLPRIGLLQIINELATRGLCDPLLPTDADRYGLIDVARKRLRQATNTVKNQSEMHGILVVLDASDNAQLEAQARNEDAFPRLLLASLSDEPIDGVKLLLTGRPHRMKDVVGKSQIERLELKPFTEAETRRFLETRRSSITDVEFSTALSRSRGNARVLEYLVESWDTNVTGNAPKTVITAEELIAQKCEKIFADLYKAGWSDAEVHEFFSALSLLPPPIPLNELAEALGWSISQVNSAASDLAPMLELVKHGAIFRDEPTETYIHDHYAKGAPAQQSIAQRLQRRQTDSIYAAEALPHFLVVIGDSDRAYQLATSNDFPTEIESEHGRRRLKLNRLHAAFSLAIRDHDYDRALKLTMQLSLVASANARGDQFIRRSPALATMLGDSDASRRLFNDRSGWRGSRDARLVIAHCFSDELDEAKIHQNRAIGWINWYLFSDEESKRSNGSPDAPDIAAVMFLSVLKNEFSSFNRNISIWRPKFSLSVVEQLIMLCAQHEESNESEALQRLARFAASKKCLSLALQVGLLAQEFGLSKSVLKAISRAANSLSHKLMKKIPEDHDDYKKGLQSSIGSAAMSSIVVNSRLSAKRLLDLYPHRRPSAYDYGERHGTSRAWAPVQSACLTAWSSGETLSFHHLMPYDVKTGRKTRAIHTEAELSIFLDSLTVTRNRNTMQKIKPEKQQQFSRSESENIVDGVACILKLVKPIETALLSNQALSNNVLTEFLVIWKTVLRPGIHWNAETGKDHVARYVGFGLATILLRHSETIEKKEAEELIDLVGANRFTLGDKLYILNLVARRANLDDLAGSYARVLSDDIVKDEYIEQRGEYYRDLAESLVTMSIVEAQEYFSQGLAQLDQMGGDDYDLIYSALRYAAEQPGGFLKPDLSHRLMSLCQTIFQHEPSKFGWTLFGRAASSSFGFPAIYKLIRWSDQDVADFSYGLPQLVFYLAKDGHLDERRAAVLVSICDTCDWYDWKVGDELRDLLFTANPMDRREIFSLIMEKLDREHSLGGSEGLWERQLNCMDAFEEINDEKLRVFLREQKENAQRHRRIKNARNGYDEISAGSKHSARKKKQDERAGEQAISNIITNCDPTSVASLDQAIQDLQSIEGLFYDSRQHLFKEIRNTCPFNKRIKFLEALCESTELRFDSALDEISECVQSWGESTTHVKKSITELIKKLFAFKGSEIFELRHTGISRQIHSLSELSEDPDFVLQLILETIAKEHLELGGDEWMHIATSLSHHTHSSTALKAFEDLLSSSAAKVGDEIGEGAYCAAFSGKTDEADMMADIIWHLLGDSDAFVRWEAARSLKGMLDIGLTEDIERLLDRFDLEENSSLASQEHNFGFLNAQQWLLMGLARAAKYHGETLKPLRQRIETLAKRSDLHALNKLHLVRCFIHIEGINAISPKLAQMWDEIQTPAQGIVEYDGWSQNTARRLNFDFDYEFDKHQISQLARLFRISNNEASDLIADEVIKRWPNAKNMSYFPGGVRYRGDERFETYREHIQRHALLHAATTLAKSKPVVRSSYDWHERNPWWEFLEEGDVSFEDGSWLSDHKDRVPTQAREHLLGERKGSQETLIEKKTLFQKVGFPDDPNDGFLPLYGSWVSPDGVLVHFTSALLEEWGSVGQCQRFAKQQDRNFWLPSFNSDGYVDRFATKSRFKPLIWLPEKYPIGVDEGDEWATRGAIARPKLGLVFNKLLGLTPDEDERLWYDSARKIVLRNEVWGQWRPAPDNYRSRYLDEGAILWANLDWLDENLKYGKRSLIFEFSFSKYKSSKSYDDSSGVRELYVGLKRPYKPFCFWFARKASEIYY